MTNYADGSSESAGRTPSGPTRSGSAPHSGSAGGSPARPAGRRVLSSVDVGSANRARVLQALVEHGPMSRADLARLLDVPRGTVGAMVATLLETGVLAEEAPRPPVDGIGKPARPVWFAPSAGQCGAVSIRAGLVETAVVDGRGEISSRSATPFPPSASQREIEEVVLRSAEEVLGAYRGDLSGIGLAVPALCNPTEGEVIACTPVPGLVDTKLPRLLSESFGTETLLEQDVRAFAIGERWFGAGRGAPEFAALQIDVGVGAGIVLGGRLFLGQTGNTAQVGHTCVDVRGLPCTCGLRGCWETIASLRWLRSQAAQRGIPGGAKTTPARLQRRADSGDTAAQELLGEYADNLAVGIANLAHVLDLTLFIVHGEVVRAGTPFLDLVQASVRARTLRPMSDTTSVVFSEMDQDAGLLGSAATVLTDRFGLAA